MATTSHPSADRAERWPTRSPASNDDTLTESNSYMRLIVSREPVGTRLSATIGSAHDEQVGVGLVGRTVEDDRAVAKRDHPLGFLHRRQLVRRHHERGAVLVGPAEQLEQRLLARLVEADERLVDQHQLERPHEGERDRGLLA